MEFLRWHREETSPPPDPVPRISRLIALAIHLDGLIRAGVVRDYADLARLGGVSRARITQIMNLLNLPARKREEILFLTGAGVTERGMRGNLGQVASSLCCHSSALAPQGGEGNGVEAGAE
jgi:hypothetical protein